MSIARRLHPYLAGAARLFGFTGALARPAFLDRSDAEALAADWEAVGRDIAAAMATLREEMQEDGRA